jgi:hypothetical protein
VIHRANGFIDRTLPLFSCFRQRRCGASFSRPQRAEVAYVNAVFRPPFGITTTTGDVILCNIDAAASLSPTLLFNHLFFPKQPLCNYLLIYAKESNRLIKLPLRYIGSSK